MDSIADCRSEQSKLPHCLLQIRWTGEPRAKYPCVSRQFNLKGAKSPDHSFSIQLPEKGMTVSFIKHRVVSVLRITYLSNFERDKINIR